MDEFIKHVFYINLDSRPDRKQHVEEQLASIGITNYTRFNALKNKNGAIGCTMSHLKILEHAKRNNLEHVLIVEDDILFLKPQQFVHQFTKFWTRFNDIFDVAIIAGNNAAPYEPVDDCCVQVQGCQTTTGYIVRRHYYDKLIDNIKTGLLHLMREPQKHVMYAIDKYWFNLQRRDQWYLIVPLTVVQREDYSDIEKRPTNYMAAMLDLDKPYFIGTMSCRKPTDFELGLVDSLGRRK